MKVSIIIPFHKGVFFLEDTLQSLKEQRYKDIEVILVCDRVEEEIDSLLLQYKDELDLKVLFLEGKSGVAAARNLGLSRAKGEYIYFLDSDDFVDENALALLVDMADTESADLVYGKKVWTWFKRSTFLANLSRNIKEEEGEDSEGDEGDEDAGSSGELDLENGGESENESSVEDDRLLREASIEAEEANESYDKRKMAYWQLISSKKGVRSITILNLLIRRSVIVENHLQFAEDIIYLSDYPFLLQLLQYVDVIDRELNALYMKRHHNDSINYPSLSQLQGSKSFKEYVYAYEYATGLIKPDGELRQRLDKKLLQYYIRFFAPHLNRRKKLKTRNEQFEVMHNLVKNMDYELIRQLKGYRHRLLKALVEGNIKRTISIVNRHLAFRRIKRIIKSRRALAKFLYIHLFLKSKVKDNWVFCESFFGKNYSDSPKYVYEYLNEKYPGKYRFIWVIDKKHTEVPYKHTEVKRFSIRYCYYLARCKYYIFNGRQPEWIRKRNGNIFLQTWHGTPLKRLVFDLENINLSTIKYKNQTYKQSRSWDYLIAANQFSSEIFRRCFRYDKVMLETGYPRNDILHHKDKEQISDRIKEELGILKGKKTILYAPTWRDDEYYTKGKYKFELQLDLRRMKEQIGNEYVILLRTHYFIVDSLDVTGLEDFAYNLSLYDDIAELYLISDILITDYSSVFFDYANLKRPMLFFMYDLEKYRDILRGFYINIEEELPGPLLFTTEEVVDAIKGIDAVEKQYKEKYEVFYDRFCAWEDGHASLKVAEAVFNPGEHSES